MIVGLYQCPSPGSTAKGLEVVAQALEGENRSSSGPTLTLEHEERFRPGRPVPTHRDQVTGDAASSS